jgi:hypothetical protein
MYELSITQGVVKIYEVNGNQKNEIPIQPDGPTRGLLRLIGKSDQQERPNVKFPLSAGQKVDLSVRNYTRRVTSGSTEVCGG